MELGLAIEISPTDSDPGHALIKAITGNITRGMQRTFAKRSTWIIGPENSCPPLNID